MEEVDNVEFDRCLTKFFVTGCGGGIIRPVTFGLLSLVSTDLVELSFELDRNASPYFDAIIVASLLISSLHGSGGGGGSSDTDGLVVGEIPCCWWWWWWG